MTTTASRPWLFVVIKSAKRNSIMLKRIVKFFMPSSKKLGKMAAEKIKSAVNQSGKEQLIAKYSGLVSNAVNTQKWLSDILLDGKIDDMEEDEIARRLAIIFDKVRDLI